MSWSMSTLSNSTLRMIYLFSVIMDFLALILGAVMSGGVVVEYGKQPLDIDLVEQVSTVHIHHRWFSSDSPRQLMIQKSYDLWGLEFVTMLECESGFNPNAVWDSGRSYGLCQMNTRWHDLPAEYYSDWEYQVEYCYRKWSTWTKFYWPNRMVNGRRCKDAVIDRFVID